MKDLPPIPSGWEVEGAPNQKLPPIPSGFKLEATGGVVDGDTIRLADGRNARLSGFDAWEQDQLGYRAGRGPVRIGQNATNALDGYVTPETDVRGIGKETFGRPVVVARDGEFDTVLPMLWQGHGLAAPEYLRDDPERRGEYLEAERLGRLNNQGAHATQHLPPDVHRKASRWNLKLRPDEAVAFTSELPELRPEFQRLTDQEERDFYAFLASKAGDQTFGQADLDAYWKGKGKTASAPASPEFIESIRSGQRVGTIDYSAWDAATLADFQKQNAFAGMRPEVQEAYGALLSSPDATPEQLAQFAEVNGMTFDPRDVAAFFDARKAGRTAPIPLPLINPGDGRTGAAVRGFGDPLGFLDEIGGVADTMGATGYRENIWNSDRSFGDIYENNVRQNRAIIDHDETTHPYYRLAGQLIGGSIVPIGAGARTVGGFAKAGAIEGGIYGAGSADGSLGDRLMNIPANAALGTIGGGAVGTVVSGIKGLSSRFAKMIRRPNVTPEEQAANARRVAAFEEALGRDVAPDATEITQEQVARAFQAADMAADNANPTISSPRLPDLIDVASSRPGLIADGPSADLVQAATARVEPGDVLPRASDEVSAEEAGKLAQGPYETVTAPRERDVLETRQFPSRANPDNMLNRRGPLDLAAFVRAEGGVADFRGELKAAGLSNAPRKGDDFAGGENRLGPLLNDESGTTLDDMAQRAWEAGYFPDHATRPTVDEFVTALGDTYRGVNRTFRPDDFAEIDAFNAARDQRLAVERARQEGAPLVDDVGQPATYDDIIANTPPPVDPTEWNPATLAKVGNIRVNKLDSPQEISRALKVANDITGGFEVSRRGVITQAETEALATDLGMSVEQLLSRRKGQAFNAEEALAARRILAASGNELVNLARRVQRLENPGDDVMAEFRRAMVRHTAIQEQIAGITAEAGRTLQQFRQMANGRQVSGKVLEGFVNGGGGPDRIRRAAEAIIDLERDPANLNRFVEKAAKPRFRDKAVEIWYNWLLSGPQTHAVNVLSNTLTSLAQIPEHGAAAMIGQGRRAFSKTDIDRVTFSEVGARATGLLQGTREGLRAFAQAFRTGEPSDFVSKIEGQEQKAIGGLAGEIIRVPTRLLTAEDELFKAIARRQALAGLAVRAAGQKGLKGEDAARYASDLVNNPPDDMFEEALDYARYVTFQRKLGPVGSKVSAITNEMPILKAVLPFIRTPTNLIKFTVERSPVAPLLREWRKDFAAGGARRDIAIARAAVGSGIGAIIAELAAEGIITGSAPSDDNRRRLMMADGWQPYSLKIGDKYYSYRRLDPFAMTFGTAADIATLGEGMSEKQREEGVGLVVGSIISNLTNKTWLSGITDALEAIRDPERYSGNFIERLAGSAAVPTGLAQIARTIDPTMRQTDGVAEAVQNRIPGMTDDLLPRRDVWGQPIVSEGGVGPDIVSPIWTSTAKNDPITQEVLRVGGSVSVPQKGDLSPQNYDKLLEKRGVIARSWLGKLFDAPEYRSLPAEDQAEEIRKTMAAATKAAKANIFGGEAVPEARPEGRKRKSELPPLPTGFSPLPAIPEGFELAQ